MKTSCGAIFYTYNSAGELGLILGLEDHQWFTFKGCNEPNETFEQTAIREIFEETCGLIQLNNIDLEHKFASKHKKYQIGLVEVPYNLIKLFYEKRQCESRINFREKKAIKFFYLEDALNDPVVHNITKASIRFFWNKLVKKNSHEDRWERIISAGYEPPNLAKLEIQNRSAQENMEVDDYKEAKTPIIYFHHKLNAFKSLNTSKSLNSLKPLNTSKSLITSNSFNTPKSAAQTKKNSWNKLFNKKASSNYNWRARHRSPPLLN